MIYSICRLTIIKVVIQNYNTTVSFPLVVLIYHMNSIKFQATINSKKKKFLKINNFIKFQLFNNLNTISEYFSSSITFLFISKKFEMLLIASFFSSFQSYH
ncbi:hypothetical protein pb186bvf_005360 [Paramecium bursaria]